MSVGTIIAVVIVVAIAIPGVRAMVKLLSGKHDSCGDCKGCTSGSCPSSEAVNRMLEDVEKSDTCNCRH